jgi:hypothetical protein
LEAGTARREAETAVGTADREKALISLQNI